MENLIGDEVSRIAERSTRGVMPHHYGKGEIRAGRKMGHINIVKLFEG